MKRYKTIKEAIEAAKKDVRKTAICSKQDDEGGYVLLEISNTGINDEMCPCYQVAMANNSIAEAVCSGSKLNSEINYCML